VVPSSSTKRVCTPVNGSPTEPGLRSPSTRVDSVISDSVEPYRSTGWCPVSRDSLSKTGTGSGALPDTSSRADDKARAAPSSSATRDHTVGTPKYIEPPASAYAAGDGFPVCTKRFPIRSDPSSPSTRPCTWYSGSPCTRVSSGVHCHASASMSMSAATARLLTTTPLGGPVVPEV
jgi:hypothetical protein